MTEPEKLFLTVMEAAIYANVSETMVRGWLKKGLPYIKHGPHNSAIRIRLTDLDQFLARNTRQLGAPPEQGTVPA